MAPGAVPKTRLAKMTNLESGYTTKVNEEDFKKLPPAGCPIVLLYNGHNHYMPTAQMNAAQSNNWKLIQLHTLGRATQTIINEVDRDKCTPAQSKLLDCLSQQLGLAETILNPSANITQLTQATRTVLRRQGPTIDITQASPAPEISGTPAVLNPAPSSSTASTSGSGGGTPQFPATRRDGKYYCDICGEDKGRKNNMVDHLVKQHKIGSRPQCNICSKTYASKRSLKQHMAHHKGEWNYICTKLRCNFHTDSKGLYKSHMSIHKRNKKVHKCQKCKKKFETVIGLNRHSKRGTCNIRKNFQCEQCQRWYKTPAGRDFHSKVHDPDYKKWACQKKNCETVTFTRSGMINHMKWHQSLVIALRARKVARKKAAGNYSDTSSVI